MVSFNKSLVCKRLRLTQTVNTLREMVNALREMVNALGIILHPAPIGSMLRQKRMTERNAPGDRPALAPQGAVVYIHGTPVKACDHA